MVDHIYLVLIDLWCVVVVVVVVGGLGGGAMVGYQDICGNRNGLGDDNHCWYIVVSLDHFVVAGGAADGAGAGVGGHLYDHQDTPYEMGRSNQ